MRCLSRHTKTKLKRSEKKEWCNEIGYLQPNHFLWLMITAGGGWLWNYALETRLAKDYPCPLRVQK